MESLSEIHERLLEEVDYEFEAGNTRWFREHLQEKGIINGVHVPKIYDAFSSARVLTTEFIDGKHLEAWLNDNPSQNIRNAASQRLEDIFAYSTLTLQRLHADPNPGNYLFHDDGSVTLIDFGCVKHLSSLFVEVIPRLDQAYYDNDHVALFKEYKKLDMFHAKEGSPCTKKS